MISFPSWPSYSNEEANKAKNIILSNKVNYWTGTECRKFEEEFASFSDTKYAVALANGTLALDSALKALDIGKGDEVIVTSRTFIASVSSIINIGATPIFADICLNSQNIKPSQIKKLVTKKTKAIMCVHLAGWPCEMDEIITIAQRFNLFIIEDCAQAHGAKYKGKPVGSIGHIGCWSFCQDKIITTGGEGGMVTTSNVNLWKKIWAYKDHGKSYKAVYSKKHSQGFRWLHESFGTNFRMTEIQGAIGRYQLKKIKTWTRLRNRNQELIWKTCKSIKGLRVPEFNSYGKNDETKSVHGAYKAYVFVESNKLKSGWNRDKIISEIKKQGVPCFSGSCSEVYLEKAFEKTSYRPKKRLKNANELGNSSLVFLIHPTLKKTDIEFFCKIIRQVMYAAAP